MRALIYWLGVGSGVLLGFFPESAALRQAGLLKLTRGTLRRPDQMGSFYLSEKTLYGDSGETNLGKE